ncbi:MAG: GTPase [Acidimicrobiia bacterium]|nr:GTPase [Acidimicrobiia bacterium]
MNRVIGRREAIVEERPGVTRDRKEAEADWCGRTFRVVDTGGWLPGGDDLDRKVSEQAERAVLDADVVVLVVDVTVGVTEEDARAASWLRRVAEPVFLARWSTRSTTLSREGEVWEFVKLGLGEPHPVSALHGRLDGRPPRCRRSTRSRRRRRDPRVR